MPFGNAVVVIDGAALIVMVSGLVVLSCPDSTRTVKLKVPGVVGVPLIAPVVGFNVRPVGSCPLDTLHALLPLPPVTCRVCAYARPAVQSGTDDVTIKIGSAAAPIVICSAFSVATEFASVTRAVKLTTPAAGGVPLNTPLEAFTESQPGLPTSAHARGATPPVAARLAVYG